MTTTMIQPTVYHFLNLTNGLQAIADYGLTDYRLIRLQSTACEQKRWADILMSLSDEFLFRLAQGHYCVVYDYGARKDVPRAVWQGLEWVKFALNRRWYGREYQPVGRSASSAAYFDAQYACLSKRVRARLDYFGKFKDSQIRLHAVVGSTILDGKIGDQYAANLSG